MHRFNLQNLIYYDTLHHILVGIQYIISGKNNGFKKRNRRKNKKIRKKRKYTQEQLAEMIGISPRNLSNIEKGVNFAKANTLEKILISLNITTEELFSNVEIKDSNILIQEIITSVQSLKDDRQNLEKIHKILKYLIDN